MEHLTDRVTGWVLRSVATALLFAGVSVLVAGVPLLGMLTGSAVARTIAGLFLQLSGVFVVAGATARYLSRPRGPLLPNERTATADADPKPDLARGQTLLVQKGCLKCHALRGEGGRIGQDLSERTAAFASPSAPPCGEISGISISIVAWRRRRRRL